MLEGFIDYANKDAWKDYIESYVVPLWRFSLILKEFSENLKKEFNNVPLRDISDKDLPLILGGVAPGDDVYKRNSLAKFYSRFFGLKASDLRSWIVGGDHVRVSAVVEETAFTRFVGEVFRWVDRALQSQGLVGYAVPDIDYEGLKRDPGRVFGLVKEFYQSVLAISANYNYYTFFLWSIKQIPYRFMKAAYPRIDQVLDFLREEFGLTIFRLNIPLNESSNLYKDYTIWCWPEYNIPPEGVGSVTPENSRERSFGGSICILNKIIWKYLARGTDLEKIMREYFTLFPYLREEYVNKVKGRLVGRPYNVIYFRGILAAETADKLNNTNLTIMDAIDEISPYLFTGLAEIAIVNNGYSSIHGNYRFIMLSYIQV